jgi:hypothetical protein
MLTSKKEQFDKKEGEFDDDIPAGNIVFSRNGAYSDFVFFCLRLCTMVMLPILLLTGLIVFIFYPYLSFLILFLVFALLAQFLIDDYRVAVRQRECVEKGVHYYGPKAKISISPLVYRDPKQALKRLRNEITVGIIGLLCAVPMLIISVCITENIPTFDFNTIRFINIFGSAI